MREGGGENEQQGCQSVLSCHVGLRDWLRSVDLVTGAFCEVCDANVKVTVTQSSISSLTAL